MAFYANHTLQVSQADRYRFPSTQFGYRISPNCSPYILQDFSQVLNRLMHLEAYCDGDSIAGTSIKEESASSEPDLFQALFFPRSIAPRTPMKAVAATQMTEETLSAMWFRLVAHYFEWLTGISEIQYMAHEDKVRLVVCHLCKVVCLSVVYTNYTCKGSEQEDCLFFGSEFYWDPARSNDPLMDEYCLEMKRTVNRILAPVKKFGMSREEFILIKLMILFDCTNLTGISDEGLEFARSMCNKYRATLSQLVRFHVEEMGVAEGWSGEQIDRYSMEKLKCLLDVPMSIEVLGKLDDDSLADMVENNYGGMRGILQQQIHTESRKIRRF
uniref:NR LBD domain-containing protein n=2 Tax=Caenorhabditis japonica TaxID=281687 RepID=A0A8R1DPF5_CAEJA